MILIFSNNEEVTTTEVIKWLINMNKKFILVHEYEVFTISVIKKKFFLKSQRNEFFLDDVHSVWYRRGCLKFKKVKYQNRMVNVHMHEVQHWLEDYVLKTLESKRHINKESNSSVNKLFVLEKAKEVGLDVPNYFLAENTDDVLLNKTITKTIAEGMYLENIFEDEFAYTYTSVVTKKSKQKLFPSFFQEKIEKDFEVRTFYFRSKIWSFAIFSQNDEKTKVDFRNYNEEKPNRNVGYNLPKEVEGKIDLLMKSLDLNCGSIDFMKSGDTFYFLEINPIGQFLSLSYTCNYYLEKEIANYL